MSAERHRATREILRVAQNDEAVARATRRMVLKRDGYRCTMCGATEDLQVHHVVPRRADGSNDSANLTTLCAECHARADEHGFEYSD